MILYEAKHINFPSYGKAVQINYPNQQLHVFVIQNVLKKTTEIQV